MKPKGTWESQLGVTVVKGVPERVEYSGLYDQGAVGGPQTCEFEVNRQDGKTRWEVQGQRTRIWLAGNSNAEVPNVEINTSSKQMEVKFSLEKRRRLLWCRRGFPPTHDSNGAG
ncbi:MAG: hypothetical protein HYZ17_07405 [Betaproteobacteria bacterium]|nr:hypothetical protein [Betaproteobacteria bacterium]